MSSVATVFREEFGRSVAVLARTLGDLDLEASAWDADRVRQREALLAAAVVGYLCKHNATLSAAEGGCQAAGGRPAAREAAGEIRLAALGQLGPQLVRARCLAA